LATAIELVEKTGATHHASFCLFELVDLEGRKKLREPSKLISLFKY